MVVSDGLALTLAGIGIALAVPLTFMVANWVRKNVDHGEARFDSSGRMISDEEERDEA
ncbi:MAG: glutamyl-tRNA amidotransferase [Erythrobacter sp.]|nr:MAG: glutamyl-tRNA amidotransferase [Erythrobacter sp.]